METKLKPLSQRNRNSALPMGDMGVLWVEVGETGSVWLTQTLGFRISVHVY